MTAATSTTDTTAASDADSPATPFYVASDIKRRFRRTKAEIISN